MSNFEFSDYIEPLSIPAARSAFTVKMEGLPVGKAFLVSGMKRENLASRVKMFRARHPDKKFSISKTDREGYFQVYRSE